MNLTSEEIAKKIKEGRAKRKSEAKQESSKHVDEKQTEEIDFMKQAGEIYAYKLKNPQIDIEQLSNKFSIFYTIFPEVINYMVSGNAYSPRAFQKVLEKRKKMPRTRQANWMLQGTYARELYRSGCSHYDTAKANEIYKTTYENYEKTYAEMEKLEEQLKQEREQRDREYSKERRKELMEFLRNMKNKENK